MKKNWITYRLPTREDSKWCKYGGEQVIILIDSTSEERWVEWHFVQKISNNKIQPWRSPTDVDIKERIVKTENLIQEIQYSGYSNDYRNR